MLHPLEQKLAEAWPPADWADLTVLVAVSGGGDSAALLRALAALKSGGAGRLCAAHLNHRLRPEADADERFVVELCDRLKISCEVERIDVGRLAAASGDGIEAAARAARYRFFEQAAGRLGARFVATAHTADDQAETILHRIVRGTGIRGLSGMARARPLGHAALIRPLLGVRRAELTAYLDAIGQPCRRDASNDDTRFTRNRIRHRLLPQLERHFNPDVVDALLRLGSLAGESQAAVDRQVGEWFDRCVKIVGPNEARIDLNAACLAPAPTPGEAAMPRSLAKLPARAPGQKEFSPGMASHEQHYLLRELMMTLWRRMDWPRQSMGMAQWEELAELAAQPNSSAKRVFPGGIVAEVADGAMRLRR